MLRLEILSNTHLFENNRTHLFPFAGFTLAKLFFVVFQCIVFDKWFFKVTNIFNPQDTN